MNTFRQLMAFRRMANEKLQIGDEVSISFTPTSDSLIIVIRWPVPGDQMECRFHITSEEIKYSNLADEAMMGRIIENLHDRLRMPENLPTMGQLSELYNRKEDN